MRIGFVGLGAMGRGLAGRLAAAGHEVRAWNRTPFHRPPPKRRYEGNTAPHTPESRQKGSKWIVWGTPPALFLSRAMSRFRYVRYNKMII